MVRSLKRVSFTSGHEWPPLYGLGDNAFKGAMASDVVGEKSRRSTNCILATDTAKFGQ